MINFIEWLLPGLAVSKERKIARELTATVKHLPGGHSQASHGRRGNPGTSDENPVIGKTMYGNHQIHKITNTSNISEYQTFAVAKDNSDILATKDDNVYHSDMVQAIHYPKKTVDDYVRFTVNSRGEIVSDSGSAGIIINNSADRSKAIDSIYKALDHLVSLGLSRNAPVVIFTVDDKTRETLTIRTTAKQYKKESA